MARLRPGQALGLGLGLALLPTTYLLAVDRFSSPGWPRFLPDEARLARALGSADAYPIEHWPKAAAPWHAQLVAGEALPWLPLPPATERVPHGFLVREAERPLRLPQFYFPSWAAWDLAGKVPVRADPDGMLEVAVDRPVRNLRVEVVTTDWERAGWAVTGLTVLLLLGLVWFGLRRGREDPRWRLPRRVCHTQSEAGTEGHMLYRL